MASSYCQMLLGECDQSFFIQMLAYASLGRTLDWTIQHRCPEKIFWPLMLQLWGRMNAKDPIQASILQGYRYHVASQNHVQGHYLGVWDDDISLVRGGHHQCGSSYCQSAGTAQTQRERTKGFHHLGDRTEELFLAGYFYAQSLSYVNRRSNWPIVSPESPAC